MLKQIPLLLFCILSITVKAQTLNVSIDKNYFGTDEVKSLLVVHLKNLGNYNKLTSYTSVQLTLDQTAHTFIIPPDSFSTRRSYTVRSGLNNKTYRLYFTPFPLISIHSSTTIVDEPKVLADFIYADKEQVVTSAIGIELRGGNSLGHPKKTYDLEFWLDSSGVTKHDVKFQQMRSDDDWILDGLYNEPLRLRSRIASKLWLDMQQPYYLAREPKAKSGADLEYAELFLNGRYEGIYNLSEQVDRKLLQLKEQQTGFTGELYKGVGFGATMFTSISAYNNFAVEWDGYEVKYPKEVTDIGWGNLYGLTDFVMNSCDAEFVNNIWKQFDYDNYMNYFIFLNLIRATDNLGKNIYTACYQQDDPYFYIPWDLDGCFGTIWTGAKADKVDDVLANDFHKRVLKLNPGNCSKALANKWFNYRRQTLSENRIAQMIQGQYQFLLSNKMYEREDIAYPSYKPSPFDLSYTLDWVNRRLSFLDGYYNELLDTKPRHTGTELVLYPNPTKDKVCVLNYHEGIDHTFRIYDLGGKLIHRGNIRDEHISLQGVGAGVYIVMVNDKPHKLTVYE